MFFNHFAFLHFALILQSTWGSRFPNEQWRGDAPKVLLSRGLGKRVGTQLKGSHEGLMSVPISYLGQVFSDWGLRSMCVER